MKLIHTADWHLGKRLAGFSLAEQQREALVRLLEVVDAENPDVVVVAGDVFDTPVPPLSALECWEWFVGQLVNDRRIPLVAIPGNHDHPERLGVNASAARDAGLYILNDLGTAHVPVTIGGVELFGLPFHKPAHVRALLAREAAQAEAGGDGLASDGTAGVGFASDGFTRERTAIEGTHSEGTASDATVGDGTTADDVSADTTPDERDASARQDDDYDAAMRRMLARIRGARTPGTLGVLVGHAFVDGAGEEPEGEDAILVGGAGGVHPSALAGFDYVALGHIHGRRACDADGRVRYAGSLYPYGFDDRDAPKSVDVVTLTADGLRARPVPLPVGRKVRVIEGKSFDEVLREAATTDTAALQDFVLVRVTDTRPLDNAQPRLREYYPNGLLQQPAIGAETGTSRFSGDARTIGVEDAFRAFYQHVYEEPLRGEEERLLLEILQEDEPTPEDAPDDAPAGARSDVRSGAS